MKHSNYGTIANRTSPNGFKLTNLVDILHFNVIGSTFL